MSKTQSRLGVTIDNKCKSIDLFLTPAIGEPGELVTLHVNGLIDTDDEWNTWEWEYADKFGIGSDYNDEPVWAEYQTGGVTHTIGEDDRVVRVKLTNGDCIYWSNESGYENIILATTPYATAYTASDTIIGGDPEIKVNFTTASSSSGYLSASAVTDSFAAASQALIWKIEYSGWLQFAAGGQSLSLSVYLNGVSVPQLAQDIKTSNGEYLPFSKSWIMSVPVGQTIDLRAVSPTDDVTILNTTLVLHQIS